MNVDMRGNWLMFAFPSHVSGQMGVACRASTVDVDRCSCTI